MSLLGVVFIFGVIAILVSAYVFHDFSSDQAMRTGLKRGKKTMTAKTAKDTLWYVIKILGFVGAMIIGMVTMQRAFADTYASCDRIAAAEQRADRHEARLDIIESAFGERLDALRAEFKADQRETRLQMREQFNDLRKYIDKDRAP